MKPEFEKYRGARGVPKDMVSSRLPRTLKAEVEIIALAEEDTLSGLLMEGLARVLEDRRSDPDYVANLRQAAEQRVETLQAELDATQAMLEHLIN